ncbi:MAG: hypothetical protein ACE5G2_10000 [Candidatus Krumholzibacteriia bacterium]
MRVASSIAAHALAAWSLIVLAPPGFASHDPDRTATIYVHGFSRDGVDLHGVYGDDVAEPLLDDVAALVGLPTIHQPGAAFLPNVVTATTYYGDTPPSWYVAQDIAEIDQITAQWGGGVPRYALIVAKYARHVMQRSGAEQVNFVSASFGSFVVRWLIEKNVGGLSGEGRVARWLSVEGVLNGSWAASQDELIGLWELVEAPPLDVQQMHYDWIDANLHTPRTEADNPLYAGILIGQIGSTDDRLNDRALTAAMLLYGEFAPNDGVQSLPDAYFRDVTEPARFLGMPPMLGFFHDTHYRLRENPGAWAQAATFFTQRRRVTVTMTRAQVTDIHEPSLPFWDWRPGEVVFESRVRSPAVLARWGIGQPIMTRHIEGASSPIRRYQSDGEVQIVTHVLFDDFVLDEETELEIELWAEEIDLDLRYGVAETVSQPYFEDLGGGTIRVSVQQPGTYRFDASDWNGDLEVQIFEYPFDLPTDASGARGRAVPPSAALRLVPNPFASTVRITVFAPAGARLAFANGWRSAAANLPVPATLHVHDVAGRRVRSVAGNLQDGFFWNGRDDAGRRLPTGVYLYSVGTPTHTFHAKGFLVR